jgi:hypothetical protein
MMKNLALVEGSAERFVIQIPMLEPSVAGVCSLVEWASRLVYHSPQGRALACPHVLYSALQLRLEVGIFEFREG